MEVTAMDTWLVTLEILPGPNTHVFFLGLSRYIYVLLVLLPIIFYISLPWHLTLTALFAVPIVAPRPFPWPLQPSQLPSRLSRVLSRPSESLIRTLMQKITGVRFPIRFASLPSSTSHRVVYWRV